MKISEEKYIGLALALISSFLIGVSFVLTKKGLINSNRKYSEEHSYDYLKNTTWWLGFICMALGEVCNFAAYSFAPAILVTPLGALSVIVGAVLASIILNETMDRIGKIGCALCILGSIIIVIHSPEDPALNSVAEVMEHFRGFLFLLYFISVLCFSAFLIYFVAPKYGKTHLLVYVTICSLVGSITVISCKGFGIAIKLTLGGNNQLTNPATYLFSFLIVICILVQMIYFNKALDTFSTNLVTPIYYVMFTTATIVASLLFFNGFHASPVEFISILVGFLIIFVGVFLLNSTKTDQYKYLANIEAGYDMNIFNLKDDLSGDITKN